MRVGHQGLFQYPVTDLVYNRHRMLHTRLGRFTSRDPLGYVDGMNLYQYLQSTPILFRDPYGTSSAESREVWGDISSAIAHLERKHHHNATTYEDAKKECISTLISGIKWVSVSHQLKEAAKVGWQFGTAVATTHPWLRGPVTAAELGKAIQQKDQAALVNWFVDQISAVGARKVDDILDDAGVENKHALAQQLATTDNLVEEELDSSYNWHSQSSMTGLGIVPTDRPSTCDEECTDGTHDVYTDLNGEHLTIDAYGEVEYDDGCYSCSLFVEWDDVEIENDMEIKVRAKKQ
jgi:RHS repeat-associated protein